MDNSGNIENQYNTQNGNLEKKVEHILVSKFQFWMAIFVFLIPIVAFFFKIQLDIALIKQNHEAHIESAMAEIERLTKEQGELLEKIDLDHEAIIKLLVSHPNIK